MAIIQISKIQQRSGNLVDLPQLSEAQLGWANDAKRLFIGGTGNANTYNENIEVLTSYSDITFSQINGSEGNLNISNVQNGQVLTYVASTNTWENAGGNLSQPNNSALYSNAGIHLGNVNNVKMGGGVNGYVLQTDGYGNLSWTVQTGGSGSNLAAPGSNTQILFNDGGNVGANASLFYNKATSILGTPTLNSTGVITATRLVSNIATGTAPFTVTSTTQVANLNVATAGTVITNAQPNITSVGTLTSLAVTGNISGANLTGTHYGAATGLTSIPGANITGTVANATYATTAGTVTTAAQPNITSVGTLSNVTVSSNVSTGGIKTDNYYYANGISISFAGAYSNSNVSAFLAVYGSNTIVTTGNITGGNVTGTHYGAATGLTSIPGANVTGTVATATSAGTATSATTAGTVTTAAQPNITSVGTLSGVTVTANVSTGGIKTDNYYYANGIPITFAGAYSNSNVANYLPTFTGTVGATALTTGASATAGTITGNWGLSSGSKLTATYADLAEYYEADKPYEPGTVVEFGGDKEVTIAEDGTTRVAGVVSTNPAYVMNSQCKGDYIVALALQGRVPCKVRGTVLKGDMLVSAGEGYARPMIHPYIGSVIGKSLENFDGIEGIIEVAVGRL